MGSCLLIIPIGKVILVRHKTSIPDNNTINWPHNVNRVGWGALCVGECHVELVPSCHSNRISAGGGAYYFAKKSINADRMQRFEADQQRRRQQEAYEHSAIASTPPISRKSTNGGPAKTDNTGSPSQEASADPAPTRHAPESEGQRIQEKSKYETTQPFRSKKGDRFSWTNGYIIRCHKDMDLA